MLVKARCPNCSHLFPVDSSFIGSKRSCPSCKNKFAFESPVAEKAQDSAAPAKAEAAEEGPRELVMCPNCIRSFSPKPVFLTRPKLLCSYCETPFAPSEGLELQKLSAAAESAFWEAVLVGKKSAEVLGSLQRLGMKSDVASNYFDAHILRLPFQRFRVVKQGKFKLPLPQECDLCPSALSPQESNAPQLVEWRYRVVHVTPNPGMLLIGTAQVTVEKFEREMIGLYFLCSDCRGKLKNWQGYPTTNGFELSKVSGCELDDRHWALI